MELVEFSVDLADLNQHILKKSTFLLKNREGIVLKEILLNFY